MCERLLSQGAEVICVDNFFTGARRNIEHLLDHKRFELIRHDVTFPLYLEIDQIYNLACPASPFTTSTIRCKRPKPACMAPSTCSALPSGLKQRSCRRRPRRSTATQIVHPQTEDYWGHVNPIGIRSCYDEGKRCAETLFFDYWRQHKLRIKVARIFNTYGPRMHPNDGRVVSNFIVQALAWDATSPIYGDGSQTRSFCYVDDLIEGLIRLMASPDAVIGPINIGNPIEFSMLQLATAVLDQTGSRSKIVHRPLPQDDPRQRQPNITKAQDLLGWQPVTPLKEGLAKTIAYFEDLLREPSFLELVGDSPKKAEPTIA